MVLDTGITSIDRLTFGFLLMERGGNDQLGVAVAKILEEKILEDYLSLGYSKINKAKTGGIGGNYIIWDKKNCEIESKKYKTRSEFQKLSRGSYKAACKNGWIDDITKHMNIRRRPISTWYDKKSCIEEAMKYKNITDFIKNSRNAYEGAKSNGFISEIKELFVNRLNT